MREVWVRKYIFRWVRFQTRGRKLSSLQKQGREVNGGRRGYTHLKGTKLLTSRPIFATQDCKPQSVRSLIKNGGGGGLAGNLIFFFK